MHADLGLGGRCMMGRVFRMMEHFGRDRCALFLPLEERIQRRDERSHEREVYAVPNRERSVFVRHACQDRKRRQNEHCCLRR